MNGFRAEQLVRVVPDDERVILVFTLGGSERFLSVDLKQLQGVMPFLVKATNPRFPEVTSISVADVMAGEGPLGDVLITLTGTAGAQMTFQLERALAMKLHALLDAGLGASPTTPTAH